MVSPRRAVLKRRRGGDRSVSSAAASFQ